MLLLFGMFVVEHALVASGYRYHAAYQLFSRHWHLPSPSAAS